MKIEPETSINRVWTRSHTKKSAFVEPIYPKKVETYNQEITPELYFSDSSSPKVEVKEAPKKIKNMREKIQKKK